MRTERLAELSTNRPALLMGRWLALGAAAGVALVLAIDALAPEGAWQLVGLLLALLTLFFICAYLIGHRERERQLDASLAKLRHGEQVVDALQRQIDRQTQMEMELMQAKQAAESASMAKGEFLATMSHEIRTPLNGIVPMLDLLIHAHLPEAQKELVRTAYMSSQQLLRIVDDILDYSKLEADRLVLESTNFNLRDMLDGVVQMMERASDAKGLRLHVQLDSNVRLPVRGDPVRLRQILTNLISNAIKFTERGSITVSIRRVRETNTQHILRFEVRDTGIGISSTAQSRLFQAFSQADASTTRIYGGTGLGLAICKRIVELMNGNIGVESQPGQGSVFWFEAPLAKVQGDLPAAEKVDPLQRVLLISNDARLRMRLGMQLPNWGFVLTSVETTQEALDRLRATGTNAGATVVPYGIVLADLQGMRSTAVALRRNLERHSTYGDTRLICLYGDEYVPEELQRNTQILARNAPDPELRQALQAKPKPALPEPMVPAAAPMTTASDGTALRNARVLLVEDNPVNLMVGQRLLAVLGVNCDTATHGEAALMRMSASRYDLVLMDCQMPVKDGYAATREWRENEISQSDGHRVPIVAMTANAMAGDRQKCLDAGMDDYLSKPVTRAELERCLYRWCKPRGVPQGPRSGSDTGPASLAAQTLSPVMPTAESAMGVPATTGQAFAQPHVPLIAASAAAFGSPAPIGKPEAVPATSVSPGPPWLDRPARSQPNPFENAAPPPPAAHRNRDTYAASAGSLGPNPSAASRSEPESEQQAIDPEIIDDLRSMLGDEVDRLIRVFLEDAPKLIAKLESAALRPDYPLLYETAHSLKSSSANLGAMPLSNAAKRIELGARAETLPKPAVAVALLAGEYERVRSALQKILDQRGSHSPAKFGVMR